MGAGFSNLDQTPAFVKSPRKAGSPRSAHALGHRARLA